MAQFTNQAFLSYGNVVAPSNIAVGEILDALSVTKTAISESYSINDKVTYIISIINSSTSPYVGLTINDNLGAYTLDGQTLVPLTYAENSVLYYVNGALQPTPTVSSVGNLVISGINVPAGGNAIIAYEASVNQFAPLDSTGTIENTATISGGGIVPIEVSEVISASSETRVSITKSISPNPVLANGTVIYTFVIENSGSTPLVATDDAVVTDTFDPILSNLTVSFNGVTLVEGTDYTYNEATGEFATTPGRVIVDGATYSRDPNTGAIITTPGVATLVVTGSI